MRRVRILTVVAAATLVTTVHSSAQQPAPAARSGRLESNPAASMREPARVLPGTRADAFTTIQGNAVTANDGALPNQLVRLRDARFGRIVDTTITDESGLFSFRSVDPGSYIVELMGSDQTVIAASQILNVNAGDAVTAIVKLPFHAPPLAGVLGRSTTSAVIVAATAAASGVLATEVAGEQKSPRR